MYTDLSVLLWAQCKYGHNTEHTHCTMYIRALIETCVPIWLCRKLVTANVPCNTTIVQCVYLYTRVYGTKLARILKDNEILLCTYMYMYMYMYNVADILTQKYVYNTCT